MNYFFDCKTKEEAKSKYRKLAKELHPDAGGNADQFKEMQKQYDEFKENDFEKVRNHFEDILFGQTFTGSYRFNKTNQSSQFYGYGNSGSRTTDGRGFNQFYNGNAFKQGYRDIPFDHPIHNVINDLKAQVSKLNGDISISESNNRWKSFRIDDLNKEIAELKKNSASLEEKIQYYESELNLWQAIANQWMEKANQKTWWDKFKELFT